MDMKIVLNDVSFARLMKEKEVPDDVIRRFIDSFAGVDETYLASGSPSWSY
jgi:hypothetical protein